MTNLNQNHSYASLQASALDSLMPMYLRLDAQGMVVSGGVTLKKVIGQPLHAGADFFDLFTIRRPSNIKTIKDLHLVIGQRLFVTFQKDQTPEMRGIAVADEGGGIVLNLSFGINIVDAVRRHTLTDTDFSPTDLTVEMLYLFEAKNLIFQEFQRLNSRLEGARSRAEEQAHTDVLSGLRNRRALDLALAAACRARIPFGLMNLDLDRFKQVNDTLGHAAGDIVLQSVARVLCRETRSGDTIARVGGDEFVILLPELIQPDKLLTVANRIIEALSKPIRFGEHYCDIGISIGLVVSWGQQRGDPDILLRMADQALYKAKRAGRGRAEFAEF